MNSDNYIKNWDNPFTELTPEAKYWIGYIFADGHLVFTDRQYSISLFSKDEEILKKFRSFMGDKARFYKRPTGICQVIYNSKPVTKWFMDTFNIPQKKALGLNPTIDIDWDILHGYFDGDGCIRMTLSKEKWPRYEAKLTTGSKIWADRVSLFLENEGISNQIKPKGNAYDINILGKVNIRTLYEKMYASNTSKLEYKYNQFVALFSNE